jgi:hypothetical protein
MAYVLIFAVTAIRLKLSPDIAPVMVTLKKRFRVK